MRDINKNIHDTIQKLSHPSLALRYRALIKIREYIKNNQIKRTQKSLGEINNHIHTWFSFSPYSPSMAAYKAWQAGLVVCGVVDHESIAGGKEMQKACKILSLGATVGCELRVNFDKTLLKNKKINNPDTEGIAYTVIHGIGTNMFTQLENFLIPIRKARAIRSEKQTRLLSKILKAVSLPSLIFEKDIVPISQYHSGGSITERHILYACAQKLIEYCGKGKAIVKILRNKFNIRIQTRIREYLLDENNPHYIYDLLGVLKSSLLPQIYIHPNKTECPPVKAVISFAKNIHAIPAYPYLGDVKKSPTGDKKAEKFEDSFLEPLFECISQLGYLACSYMPPRNTAEQLERISALCKQYNLMEISGVDINSSRQEFLYKTPKKYHHLIESAWALVAHEKAVINNSSNVLFNPQNKLNNKNMRQYIQEYVKIHKV